MTFADLNTTSPTHTYLESDQTVSRGFLGSLIYRARATPSYRMSEGEAASSAAPAALALTAAADIVATLSLTLACVKSGPLESALVPHTPSKALNVAAGLLDLLLASLLRAAITLTQLMSSSRSAGPAGLCAATTAHTLTCAWLVCKAALLLVATGGEAGGQIEIGDAANPVVLIVPSLLSTEVLGVLFSGVLLAQTVAFRRVLRQRAPRDTLSAAAPLQPDAREWLVQRQSSVHRWLEAASPDSPAPPAAAPRAPARAGGSSWQWWPKATASAPGAAAAAARGVAAAGSQPYSRAQRPLGALAAEAGASHPLLPVSAAPWGSEGESDDTGLEFGSVAPNAGASSTNAASFCTAASE